MKHKGLIVRLFEPHSPECVTVRDPEQARHRNSGGITVAEAPWHIALDEDNEQWRDIRGRGHGHKGAYSHKQRWLYFTCNDPRCSGRGVVRLDYLSAMIQAALDKTV